MKWCFYRQQTSTLRPGLRVWYCTVEQILSTLSTLFLPRTDFVYTPFTVDVSSERCNFCFWFLSPDLFLFWLRVARAGFTPSGAPVQKKSGGPVTPPPRLPSPILSEPTRTVVIIDILLRTRAAMHTSIAATTVYDASAPHKIVSFVP